MCLQQRGVLERAGRTLTLHPKSLFSPRETKAWPWCRRNGLCLCNLLQYLCEALENVNMVSFPPPKCKSKPLPCTHSRFTPWRSRLPFGSHGTARSHPEEPFQSNTREQSTRILLNSTQVSFLFSWSWGYTWWSWRIILSSLPTNNEAGERQLYLSEYSTWTVQLSQHYFQQPFCPTFPTWPTPPLHICTLSWWHITFRGRINAHSVNNPNFLRRTMLRMGKKKGH